MVRKKRFYKSRWSNQESEESTIKFINGREIDYKRVAALKKNVIFVKKRAIGLILAIIKVTK
jgi:uncharacterized protein (DUF488 family)